MDKGQTHKKRGRCDEWTKVHGKRDRRSIRADVQNLSIGRPPPVRWVGGDTSDKDGSSDQTRGKRPAPSVQNGQTTLTPKTTAEKSEVRTRAKPSRTSTKKKEAAGVDIRPDPSIRKNKKADE